MDTTQAPGTKPGWKTTEFWLSLVGMIAGVIVGSGLPEEHPAVRIAGLVLAGLSAMGYSAARGLAKRAAAFLILPLLFVLAGCAKGMVRADAIAPGLELVADRHDRMLRGELDPKGDLNGDGKVDGQDDKDRETYLRTSALLRRTIQTARE